MEPGERLGPYKIIEPLGAGGMGEVYLAQDTRLGRKVAVKVLPAEFASDPERLARFELEARAAAALNHPNIAAVFDVGAEGDTHFMVQEYLEGESIRELLAAGHVAATRALAFAVEVAEALAAAHRAGIIHRDLKPENLFVVDGGHAKVLDFGLAKLTDPALGSAPEGATMSPTVVGTMAGAVMGTAGYMAPEQVNGEAVDVRADLFAFGCVLYEMLTGKRAFAGRSLHETLSQIVHDDPPDAEVADLPMHGELGRILRKCLQKEPSKRYQGAADVAVDLRAVLADLEAGRVEGVVPEAGAATSPARAGVPVAALVVVALVAVVALLWGWNQAADPVRSEPVEFEVVLPADEVLPLGRILAFAPDGSRFVYQARAADGRRRFYLRGLGDLHASRIAGTQDGRAPTFSPDGEWLVFHDAINNTLVKVPVSGGDAVVLAPVSGVTAHSSWGDDGYVVYENSDGGVWHVAASGGAPELLAGLDPSEGAYDKPVVLPGSRTVLLEENRASGDQAVAALDVEGGDVTTLVEDAGHPFFLPPATLLFSRQGSVYAVSFDPQTLVVGTETIVALQGVQMGEDRLTHLAVSARGHVVYIPGEQARTDVLAWIGRDRTAEAIAGSEVEGVIYGVRLSPDASRVAVQSVPAVGGTVVRIFDVARQVYTRIDPRPCKHPVWTPDGQVIVALCDTDRGWAVVRRAVDLSAPTQTIWASQEGVETGSVDADGETDPLAVGGDLWRLPLDAVEIGSVDADGEVVLLSVGGDLWRLPLDGSEAPTALSETTATERQPNLSPDGRWLAYLSDQSGEGHLYVTRYPGPGPTIQVSNRAGAGSATWAADGSRLFWAASPGTVLSVDFDGSDAAPVVSAPREEHAGVVPFSPFGISYSMSADGERVLASPRQVGVGDMASNRRLHVILNWADEVHRRLAAKS